MDAEKHCSVLFFLALSKTLIYFFSPKIFQAKLRNDSSCTRWTGTGTTTASNVPAAARCSRTSAPVATPAVAWSCARATTPGKRAEYQLPPYSLHFAFWLLEHQRFRWNNYSVWKPQRIWLFLLFRLHYQKVALKTFWATSLALPRVCCGVVTW